MAVTTLDDVCQQTLAHLDALLVPSPAVSVTHKGNYGVLARVFGRPLRPFRPLPPVRPVWQLVAVDFLDRYDGNTRAAYTRDLRDYLTWCHDQQLGPDLASAADLRAYLRQQAAAGLSPATLARRAVTLRRYYALVAAECGWTSSPAAGLAVRRPRSRSRIRALTPAQIAALLEAADQASARTRGLAWLLVTTGLRISEATSARRERIWHDHDGPWLDVTCKGGLDRSIPLEPDCWQRLQPLLTGPAGPVFTTASGRQLDRHAAAKDLRALADRAGLPAPFSPHVLRHTFVTLARQAGCHLADVQDAVGHADPATTRAYDRTIAGRATHPAGPILALAQQAGRGNDAPALPSTAGRDPESLA